jgi:hypothetical protein
MCFRSTAIFTLLILPTYGHVKYFQLSVSSSISFFSVLWFSLLRYFNFLVRFTSCFLFEATMNWIVFLIFLLDYSLLVYRKATEFYMLLLYPATWSEVFISSRSPLVKSLESLPYRITSSTNRDNLTSSFLICVPFLSIALLLRLGI